MINYPSTLNLPTIYYITNVLPIYMYDSSKTFPLSFQISAFQIQMQLFYIQIYFTVSVLNFNEQNKHHFQVLLFKGGSSPLLFTLLWLLSPFSVFSYTLLLLSISLFLYLYASSYLTRTIVCIDFTISFNSLFYCSDYLHLVHVCYVVIFLRSVFWFFFIF